MNLPFMVRVFIARMIMNCLKDARITTIWIQSIKVELKPNWMTSGTILVILAEKMILTGIPEPLSKIYLLFIKIF